VQRYARHGIREYFFFDANIPARLVGHRLRAKGTPYGELKPEGGSFYSEVLELDLRVVDNELRFFFQGGMLLSSAEAALAEAARADTEAAGKREAQQRADTEAARADTEAAGRREAEQRADTEAAGRREAEQQVRVVFAELQDTKRQLEALLASLGGRKVN
jgi:hypothetical protein